MRSDSEGGLRLRDKVVTKKCDCDKGEKLDAEKVQDFQSRGSKSRDSSSLNIVLRTT